jgi:hypothetical protein
VNPGAGADVPARREGLFLLLATPLALVLLLALGCFLRLVEIRQSPPGPWVDEAYALRAARVAAADAASSPPGAFGPFAALPLEPPEAGFVNFWLPGPWLAFTALVDLLAGGGISSVRALSTVPGIALLLGAAALAWEVLRPRRGLFLGACLLLATSAWLLSTCRWGWHAVATSSLLVLSAAAGLRGARARRPGSAAGLGLLSGAFLGLAQYGYPTAWLVLPLPLAVAAFAARAGARARGGMRTQVLRTALCASAGALVLASPLLVGASRHPERFLARPSPLAGSGSAASRAAAIGSSAVGYARLFAVGGDANRRHGDPGRPPVPALVTLLALLGLVSGMRGDGRALLAAAVAALALLGGVLAAGEGPNAFRVSCAAPFLVVLAAAGGGFLAEAAPEARRGVARSIVVLVLAAASAVESAAFLSWLHDPALAGWFGGPERALADAVSAETARGRAGARPVFALDPRAVRNPFVTDALLAAPASAAPPPPVPLLPLSSLEALLARPGRPELLWAGSSVPSAGARALALGGVPVALGGSLGESYPGWTLYRFTGASPRN